MSEQIEVAVITWGAKASYELAARFTGGRWRYSGGEIESRYEPVEVHHQCVVVDPDDRESMFALRVKLEAICDNNSFDLDQLQDVFRSLTKPKPEQPRGLGAVVEDANGVEWVRKSRDAEDAWTRQVHMAFTSTSWDYIPAVKILSEGVS